MFVKGFTPFEPIYKDIWCYLKAELPPNGNMGTTLW